MQEDKEALFDAIDTVEVCLPVFAAMVNTLSVRRHNMERAAAGGFINATDCADYLVKGDALPGGLYDRRFTGQSVHQEPRDPGYP